MKVVKNSLFGLLVLLSMLTSACSGPSTVSPVETQDCSGSSDCYNAPGIVVIAFEKGMTDDSILDFVASLGLKAHGDIYGADDKWIAVAVPEETEDEWIVALLKYEIVTVAERVQICPVYE